MTRGHLAGGPGEFAPLRGRAPAVVAHRGASAAARENTLDAFALARRLGADAVELDVRRTADGTLVVHHDPDVDGLGLLARRRFAEVRASAPWVPVLDEALEACQGMWVDVEVKHLPTEPDWDPTEAAATAVARALVGAGWQGRAVVSSFSPTALLRVREAEAVLATGLLVPRGLDPAVAVAAAAEVGHVAVLPPVESLEGPAAGEIVARARASGVAVVVWTVDAPDALRRLAAAGVGGLITNVPDVARAVVGGRPPARRP